MPWENGTGPTGRGPMTGRGRGFCRGIGQPGIATQILGSLALGLLTWGGRALSRRSSTGPALPPSEPPPSLEGLPDQRAIGAGDRETGLAELQDQARSLERQLEALQQRIRELESQDSR
jgi:hypothetical protein